MVYQLLSLVKLDSTLSDTKVETIGKAVELGLEGSIIFSINQIHTFVSNIKIRDVAMS